MSKCSGHNTGRFSGASARIAASQIANASAIRAAASAPTTIVSSARTPGPPEYTSSSALAATPAADASSANVPANGSRSDPATSSTPDTDNDGSATVPNP